MGGGRVRSGGGNGEGASVLLPEGLGRGAGRDDQLVLLVLRYLTAASSEESIPMQAACVEKVHGWNCICRIILFSHPFASHPHCLICSRTQFFFSRRPTGYVRAIGTSSLVAPAGSRRGSGESVGRWEWMGSQSRGPSFVLCFLGSRLVLYHHFDDDVVDSRYQPQLRHRSCEIEEKRWS